MRNFYIAWYAVCFVVAATAFLLAYRVFEGYTSQLLASGFGGIAVGALFIPLFPSQREF